MRLPLIAVIALLARARAAVVDISGSWANGDKPLETYNLTTTDSNGDAIALPTGSPPGWSSANITIKDPASGAVFVVFSNGASHGGQLVGLPGPISSMTWADGSSWVRANPLPITVHLVPHSHNDPGWKSTLEQLYDTEVRSIYTTVVRALLGNPQRTFGAEIGVFWAIWWGEQNETTQDAVRGLVARGQLEFLGGGYSQPDEAVTSAPDLVDNLALGHLWAQSTLGHAPVRIGWQADPFGHSTAYAFIQSQAAFNALVFGRPMSAGSWGSDPVNEQSGVMWHPLASQPGNGGAFDAYSILLHDQQSGYWEPGRDCEGPIAAGNATAVALVLAGYIRSLASRPPYASNLLILMGDDFYWQTADVQLPVVDAAITLLNQNHPAIVGPGAPLNVSYSLPSKWAAALRQEQLARGNSTASFSYKRSLRQRDAVTSSGSGSGTGAGAGPLTYPQRPAWDFFPLECCEMPKPWTGYFTSRPEFKQLFKGAAAAWRAATQLHSWARGDDWEAGFGGLLPLWRALGLVQHHDAITCDAFDDVMEDYRQKVDEAVQLAGAVGAGAVASISGGDGSIPPTFCYNATMQPCDVITQTLGDRQPVVVTVYNALSQTRDSHVEMPVPFFSLSVTDAATGQPVVAQGDPTRGVIVFLASGVPAHGFRSYILSPTSTAASTESSAPSVIVATPRALPRDVLDPITLSNANISLTFTGNGSLTSVSWPGTGVSSNASALLGFYSSKQGDENAWDMSSDGSTTLAPFPALTAQNALLASGPVYSELTVNVDAAQGATIRWRVYTSTSVPVVHVWTTAGPIALGGAYANRSIDVALRIQVDAVDSGAAFVTDSNGLELLPRVRDGRPWVTGPAPRPDEPVSHNYYPVTSAIAVSSASNPAGGPAMALATGSPQGGSSMCSGCLEVGINRMVLDGSGAKQTGNRLVTAENALLLLGSGGWPALTSHLRPLAAALADPLQVWASPASEAPPSPIAPFSPVIAGALPPNLQLMTLQTLPPGLNISAAFYGRRTGAPVSASVILLRLRHVFATGEGQGGEAAPATVDLSALFAPRWSVASAVEYTIDAAQPMGAARANQIPWNAPSSSGSGSLSTGALPMGDGAGSGLAAGDGSGVSSSSSSGVTVTLQPMDIRTFVLTLQA